MDWLIWVLIPLSVSQSAMFSGLNLALLSVSRLHLDVEVANGNRRAARILKLRRDPYFLLATILLGNVAVNVLLAILSDHVMSAAMAFVFSTVIITYFGEILPQAFFARHAMRVGSAFYPVIRLYQFLLYPIAKPTAMLLDAWLGDEAVPFLQERGVRELIKQHIRSEKTNISYEEGVGALNFLALDDIAIRQEGEPLDPASIVSHDTRDGEPNLPYIPVGSGATHPFVQQVAASGRKWVILIDETGQPDRVLNADSFLRRVMMASPQSTLASIADNADNTIKNIDSNGNGNGNSNGNSNDTIENESTTATIDPRGDCHLPVIITDPATPVGTILRKLTVKPEHPQDDVIDNDVILLWSEEGKRILTGADLLGRLLRGIATREAG